MQKEYASPVGILVIKAEDGCITEIKYRFQTVSVTNRLKTVSMDEKNNTVLEQCARELDMYFAGELREFTVPVNAHGTEFRRRVWAELQRIPYGETISYKELAARIGNPAAARAVGGANHHNPVNIIIPCHRVIGADGSLTGYGGGPDKKAFLLELEGLKKD